MLNLVYTLIVASCSVEFSLCSSWKLDDEQLNSSEQTLTGDNRCPPWSYYDAVSERCICYASPVSGVIECTSEGTSMAYTYCMTYDDSEAGGIVTVSYCPYFDIQSYNINEAGRISLPDNISKLNEYMCGPLNRRGVLCNECIDGYGQSVTSSRFMCTDCSNAWYGMLLYLFTEVVPVTIFYIIVLFIRLNLTSPPITSFVLYSNIVVITYKFIVVSSNETRPYTTFFALLYGILSLDFIRPIIPPVCISPKLKIIHIMYLQSLSTVLPFVYIAITWILINLQCCDSKGVKWVREMVNKLIPKCLNNVIQWNSDGTIIDTFATFFLLSFAKITLLLIIPFYPLRALQVSALNTSSNVNITVRPFVDVSEVYASKTQLPFMVISVSVFFFLVLPAVFTIALYPTKPFRTVLLKCCHDRYIYTLKFFLEKYYSSYRDGLQGGRDMRSFASMYFFLIISCYVVWSISIYNNILICALFGGCSLMILVAQPHKKRYMTVIESLVLANFAFLTATYNRNIYASHFHQILAGVIVILPILGVSIYVCYTLLRNPCLKLLQTLQTKHPSLKPLVSCCVKNDSEDNQVESGQRA